MWIVRKRQLKVGSNNEEDANCVLLLVKWKYGVDC